VLCSCTSTVLSHAISDRRLTLAMPVQMTGITSPTPFGLPSSDSSSVKPVRGRPDGVFDLSLDVEAFTRQLPGMISNYDQDTPSLRLSARASPHFHALTLGDWIPFVQGVGSASLWLSEYLLCFIRPQRVAGQSDSELAAAIYSIPTGPFTRMGAAQHSTSAHDASPSSMSAL
jgi:hypothetical protein